MGAFSTSGAGPQFSGHTSPPSFDALAAAHNVKTEPFMSLADRHASWEPSLTLGPHGDANVCASTGLCNFGFKFGKPTTSDTRGHCLGQKGCTSRDAALKLYTWKAVLDQRWTCFGNLFGQ